MSTGLSRASTLSEALAALVETNGDEVAMIIDARESKVSYSRRAMGELAASYAAGYLEAGVRRNDRVVTDRSL